MDIKVIREGKTLIFRGEKGVSLLEQMKKQNIYISAACGGMGKCGKCKVLMTDGATEPSESDRRCFSKEEQKQGWRLACTSFPSESCTVVIYSDDESQFEIIGEYSKERQIEILTEEEYVACRKQMKSRTIGCGFAALLCMLIPSQYVCTAGGYIAFAFLIAAVSVGVMQINMIGKNGRTGT